MNEFKLDAETAREMATNLEVRNMTQSEGWRVAKEMLLRRVALLSDISTLPTNIPLEEIGKEAMFRATAVSLVIDWLNAIEGRVDQTNQQHEATIVLQESSIVREYGKHE